MTNKTLTLNAKQFEDADDCLEAAETLVRHEIPGLGGYTLGARWASDERDEIVVDLPRWAVPPRGLGAVES